MNEKQIEQRLVRAVKEIGGQAFKWHSPNITGMPDRIVLLPGGRIAFAELKSPGKKPTPRQELMIQKLRGWGFVVAIIDSYEGVRQFVEELQC